MQYAKTPILETPRLVLRPLRLADAEAAQRLFPHWEIVRYMTDRIPWPYPPDGTLTYFRENLLPAIRRGEAWCWTLRLRTSPAELIGLIELRARAEENRGFWIGIPWQQQGLMTEACDAVTEFWFNVLKQDVLRVSKAVSNVASRRLSEKQGARLIATENRNYVSGSGPAEIWELTRDEWIAHK